MSSEITIDDKEIQAAKVIKLVTLMHALSFWLVLLGVIFIFFFFLLLYFQWMPLAEFIEQPYYKEDHLSNKVIDICIAAHEDSYSGFIGHQLNSKIDGKLSYLYYDDMWIRKIKYVGIPFSVIPKVNIYVLQKSNIWYETFDLISLVIYFII